MAAWCRVILGGSTAYPLMSAGEARQWRLSVPSTVGDAVMIRSVDLLSNWDDGERSAQRTAAVRARFQTHVATGEYLMAVDELYQDAMVRVGQGPGASDHAS